MKRIHVHHKLPKELSVSKFSETDNNYSSNSGHEDAKTLTCLPNIIVHKKIYELKIKLNLSKEFIKQRNATNNNSRVYN